MGFRRILPIATLILTALFAVPDVSTSQRSPVAGSINTNAPLVSDRLSSERSRSGAAILRVDDWVRVPSAGSSSGSESTGDETSSGAQASADHPQRGPDDAPVTIIEYSDFQCPYCRETETSLRQVLRKYGDRVRLVYMDFPLSFHRNAMNAAMAARCADEQGQFWAYHDALLADPSQLSIPALESTAAKLGLDSSSFNSCLSRHKYENIVRSDQVNGEKAGARGTPYFIINGRALDGAQTYATFDAVIDSALRHADRR